jgi:hypothetical protein
MGFTNVKLVKQNGIQIDSGKGSFGEQRVTIPFPTAQGDFVYGINPQIFVTSSIGGTASVTRANGIVTASCGTSTSGSATVSLRRNVKYRPGQLTECRFTALFDEGVENTNQKAGIGNGSSGYYVGYQGEEYGFFHEYAGQRRIQEFEITAAGNASENVTITLNGNSTSFTMNPGGSTTAAAALIAGQDYSALVPGWQTEALGSSVFFIAEKSAVSDGTYSFATTGASTATVTTYLSASYKTVDFTPQSSWNLDPLDGTGPSRLVIDPQKGNVYTITFQYLGFGNAVLSVEDPTPGTPIPVHMVQNANNRNTTVLGDPNLAGEWVAENWGSATEVAVKGASIATFTDGTVRSEIGVKNSKLVSKSHAGNDGEVLLAAYRVDRLVFGKASNSEMTLLSISAGTEIGEPVLIRIRRQPAFTTVPSWSQFDANESVVSISTTGAISGGNIVATIVVPGNGSIQASLQDYDININTGDVYAITVQSLKSSSSAANTHVSISWAELQ